MGRGDATVGDSSTPNEDHRDVILATATSANVAQFGARVVVSPFVLAIAASFGVTKGPVGVALAVMWAAFALMQFPSGVFADKYGEKPVILASMAATVLGSLLVVLSPSFPVFVVAVLVLGVGTGLYLAVGTALLARRFRNHGRAFGVHTAGAPLAGLTLPAAASVVAARYDWRAGVAVGAVVAAAAFVTVHRVVGETPPTAPDLDLRRRLHPRDILERLARPGVAFTTLVAVLAMYVFQSFVSFFPTFLREYHGFDAGQASVAFAAAFAIVGVGLPLVGSLADRYGTAVGLAGPFLVSATGFGTLLVADGTVPVYAGIGLVGVGLTWGAPLQSRFMAQFAAAERGSGFGMARSVYVLVGSVGNATTGILAEATGWVVAYGVVVALMFVAAGLVVAREHGVSGQEERE